MNRGVLYAFGAYFLWGFFPIYWKWLHVVPALQVIGHRIGWSFMLLILTLLVTRQLPVFRAAAVNRRMLRIYATGGVLITVNWLVYVWGVNAGYIVETSLGYFVNPLLSVMLGVVFLRERLRPLQWLPVGLAAGGVIYLTLVHGRLPWIALVLALSFGLYGLVKKTAPLNSLVGMTLETGIMFPAALVYLLFVELRGQGGFLHDGLAVDLLLVGAGAVTTIPLVLFASAARRIPLSLIGILQYIAPSLQFLIGVLVFREPFSHHQLIGFGVVWVALVIFWVEGFLAHRTASLEPIPELGEG